MHKQLNLRLIVIETVSHTVSGNFRETLCQEATGVQVGDASSSWLESIKNLVPKGQQWSCHSRSVCQKQRQHRHRHRQPQPQRMWNKINIDKWAFVIYVAWLMQRTLDEFIMAARGLNWVDLMANATTIARLLGKQVARIFAECGPHISAGT